MGRLCYPTTAPPQNCPGRPQSCHAVPRMSEAKSGVQGGYGALFAVWVQNYIEHYACRGIKLIEAGKLSSATNFIEGTGAVLSRRSGAESGVAVQC
jgi:hypothetical protein